MDLAFLEKQIQALKGSRKDLLLSGIEASKWAFLYHHTDSSRSFRHNLFIFDSQEKAEYYYGHLKRTWPEKSFLYPGLDSSPYGRFIHSDLPLFERFRTLSILSSLPEKNDLAIFTSIEALNLLVPTQDFFRKNEITLSVSDILSPQELSEKLVKIGYSSNLSIEEQGTFYNKGEVFDIYPIHGPPIRLYYFDDMIEEIFSIDKETKRTQRNVSFDSITLSPTPRLFSSSTFSLTLRQNLPRFNPDQAEKKQFKEELLNKLSDEYLFDSYSIYCPLFLTQKITLLDYFDSKKDMLHVFDDENCHQTFNQYITELEDEYQKNYQEKTNPCILPSPIHLYSIPQKNSWNDLPRCHVNTFLSPKKETKPHLDLSFEPASTYLKKRFSRAFQNEQGMSAMITAITNYYKENKNVFFVLIHESTKKKLDIILEEKFPLSYQFGFLEQGFHNHYNNFLIISETDLIPTQKKMTKSPSNTRNPDLFAEQLGSLKINDYIIHKDHGIGRYKGMETLSVGDTINDFVIIEYQDQDKIYVPAYKIGRIQKHSDSSAKIKVANLKNNKFEKIKSRSKISAKKLAFNLLELQAKRENSLSHCFPPPDDFFRSFEQKFPFQETFDQTTAIQAVIEDMQKPRPMDRLICGDVGFGKTEVAMRAAFKAVQDDMQVAIMVPTTILALQHYHSFKQRFDGFPVEIDFISRFKSIKEINDTIKKISSGQIDILIGTHKILSDRLSFKNLGLLVIDEEQRFGVSHKEKLKSVKASIDVLTLTATPIPRTLQLAFLDIRDLSLIQTAPPKRQSIKSYIVKHNDETIKTAIENELKRGGQIFYVHNRIQGIEKIAKKIQDLVPMARISVAHGQIPEKELEKTMNDFYNYKYDVLISTTIIESGLDIPNANTIIVHQADSFGLAQLHQLRGRIGRSQQKAYAYFLIPNDRNLSNIASRRLEALQRYTSLGSGFSLASSDLEIRGVGDILGPEQSGHLEAVGLEIYMELLKEAINELKGLESIPKQNIEILTPFSCFIPNNYIKNSGERLKIYKHLSRLKTQESLKEIRQDIEDQFGSMPNEFIQLTELLSIQLILQPLGLEEVKIFDKTIKLKFSKNYLNSNKEYQNRVIHFFTSSPQKYHFGQDFSVVRSFPFKITLKKFAEFAQEVAEKIAT